MLDELERVRAYRADVPEPDAATVSAARMALLEATRREAAMPESGRSRAGQPFFASLLRHDVAEAHKIARGRETTATRSRERLGRLQRRRRFALAGALATVGVGIAGALGLTTAATPVSALAAQMDQLAKVAASQDWTGIPGPGQYLYTESQGLDETDTMNNGQECAVQFVDHRQSWIATDGAGAIDEGGSDGRFTSSSDAAACSAMKVTPTSVDRSGGTRFPAGGLSFPTDDWRSLSTDPETLLKQVHQRDGGPDTPAEWFTNVADFMRESDVPPAIRAALYQATALIPGVKLLGQQTDQTGQTGLGVAFEVNGQPTHELIFDQQSGRLLAEDYFGATGRLTDWSSYTDQKIVDSVPNYPLELNHATAEAAPTSQQSESPATGTIAQPPG